MFSAIDVTGTRNNAIGEGALKSVTSGYQNNAQAHLEI